MRWLFWDQNSFFTLSCRWRLQSKIPVIHPHGHGFAVCLSSVWKGHIILLLIETYCLAPLHSLTWKCLQFCETRMFSNHLHSYLNSLFIHSEIDLIMLCNLSQSFVWKSLCSQSIQTFMCTQSLSPSCFTGLLPSPPDASDLTLICVRLTATVCMPSIQQLSTQLLCPVSIHWPPANRWNLLCLFIPSPAPWRLMCQTLPLPPLFFCRSLFCPCCHTFQGKLADCRCCRWWSVRLLLPPICSLSSSSSGSLSCSRLKPLLYVTAVRMHWKPLSPLWDYCSKKWRCNYLQQRPMHAFKRLFFGHISEMKQYISLQTADVWSN